MLQRLDKYCPLVVVVVLSYLTYTTMNRGAIAPARGKALPAITESMLNPEMIKPRAHASPADRDPFEVGWASYLSRSGDGGATSRHASVQPARPAEPSVPPLKGKLLAVFVRQDLRLAVIGEEVCKVGSTIGGDDPEKCWQVVAIEKDAVVVKFGNLRRVLRIASPPGPAATPTAEGRREDRR